MPTYHYGETVKVRRGGAIETLSRKWTDRDRNVSVLKGDRRARQIALRHWLYRHNFSWGSGWSNDRWTIKPPGREVKNLKTPVALTDD